jgi:hypothetical protein
MSRFAANLLFTGQPFVDRLDAAEASGFQGGKYPSPNDFDRTIVDRSIKTANRHHYHVPLAVNLGRNEPKPKKSTTTFHSNPSTALLTTRGSDASAREAGLGWFEPYSNRHGVTRPRSR